MSASFNPGARFRRMNPNYQVRGRSSHHPLGITGLQATATSGNDGTTTVALTLNKGHHIQKGPLTLTIPAGAIGDLAGNTLAGPLQTSLGASGAHRNDAAIHASTSGSTALHDLALHHLQGHRHHRATH